VYDVIFRNDYRRTQFTVVAKGVPSLEAAQAARLVAGDLVVHAGTQDIVVDERWLWPWEKTSPVSYARREIAKEAQRIYG
jgi:hypothetical protein